MPYTYLAPKNSKEIQDKFVSWLNDHLIDPYEAATSKKRDFFVYGDDFKLVAVWPKVHVALSDFVPNRIDVQSKTNYLEEEEHNFMIYYYNYKAHLYTFENGQKLNNEAQCRQYLQYIRDQIKAQADKFEEYCHRITFGTIPKPDFVPNTSIHLSVLPMTVFTYNR